MSLSPEDALTLRDGDWVLIPARVTRTNNHFDAGTGVSVYFENPTPDRRLNSEKAEKPRRDPMGTVSRLIHSVLQQELRVDDLVEFDHDERDISGRILFIDETSKEATIRLEVPIQDLKTTTRPLKALKRVLPPTTREAAKKGERP